MAGRVNKALLRQILVKRKNSEPLTNEEERYSRQVFDELMDSKKGVQKMVRIVSGERMRKDNTLSKSKVDVKPTRSDPRYPSKNPQKITGDNPNPTAEASDRKIPDADEKPKMGPVPGYEHERLSNYLQEDVKPRSEATKFVSADPVQAGDIVVKNLARAGTRVVKGVVLKVQKDLAFVKWGDGRTMTEPAHLLVKAKKADDPKLGVPEAEEDKKNPPMEKNGDIAAATNYGAEVAPSSGQQTTPFQDLTNSLQRVVDLAGDLKGKAERTDDDDVKAYYDELIGRLRETAETILSGLDAEFMEAQADELGEDVD